VSESPIEELRAGAVRRVRVETDQVAAATTVLAEAGLADVVAETTAVSAVLGEVDPTTLVPALVGAGVAVRGFAVVSPSLEDIFVGLTGEGFDVSG
jgi:ABC-2 type transport system ATP-binding protein